MSKKYSHSYVRYTKKCLYSLATKNIPEKFSFHAPELLTDEILEFSTFHNSVETVVQHAARRRESRAWHKFSRSESVRTRHVTTPWRSWESLIFHTKRVTSDAKKWAEHDCSSVFSRNNCQKPRHQTKTLKKKLRRQNFYNACCLHKTVRSRCSRI